MTNYLLFIRVGDDSFIALFVCMDHILIVSNDLHSVNKLKSLLDTKFKMKDLGQLKYSLGVKVARSQQGIF